jgi:ribonuclease D
MTNPHAYKPPPSQGYRWINSQAGLSAYCSNLKQAGAFGFDTEFIGERTFTPELCLIQICADREVALIDPLEIKDLAPLGHLISDPDLIKFCHAGSQDIAIIHECSYTPANVLDTQLMAGLVGLTYPISYARLVEHICGVQLDKAHTYSAWDRRPLAEAQLIYAADDVRYLPDIFQYLRNRIEKCGRLTWMQELCAEELQHAVAPVNTSELWLKLKAPRSMSRQQLGVLRELTAWRHQLAYEHDAPVRSFLTDSAIRDIAKTMPQTTRQLARIDGISQPELQSYGPFIIEMLEKVRRMPLHELPEMPPEPQDSLKASQFIDRVWAAAQAICLGQNVCTGLVTSQSGITDWALKKLAGQRVDDHELMQGWRRECLGQPLVELVDGRSTLTIRMNDCAFCTAMFAEK